MHVQDPPRTLSFCYLLSVYYTFHQKGKCQSMKGHLFSRYAWWVGIPIASGTGEYLMLKIWVAQEWDHQLSFSYLDWDQVAFKNPGEDCKNPSISWSGSRQSPTLSASAEQHMDCSIQPAHHIILFTLGLWVYSMSWSSLPLSLNWKVPSPCVRPTLYVWAALSSSPYLTDPILPNFFLFSS